MAPSNTTAAIITQSSENWLDKIILRVGREGEGGRKREKDREREGANPEAERKKVAHRREIERKKRDTSEFATPRKHYF